MSWGFHACQYLMLLQKQGGESLEQEFKVTLSNIQLLSFSKPLTLSSIRL